jgi:LPXTG-site transpeptidase (sortase) family protein
VNKYQFRGVSVAILAITSSLVLWTGAIDDVPLPKIRQDIVTQFETFLNKLSNSISENQQVSVHEITVEDLGVHFARTVNKIRIKASVIEETEVVDDDTAEIVEVETEEVMHAAVAELEQWGIARAWSITIPSLGIRAPVLLPSMKNWTSRAWDMLEEQMQIGLNHGAVAYPHSSGPGRKGNLIIAGHSSPPTESAKQSEFGRLFERLPEIKVGEEISIVTAGSPVRYRVEEKMIVSPQETSILEQQYDESILKLITCYPVGTTRDRMIVLAKKIEG